MLRFFRRMRKALVPENRLGRYFLYAVGEIVLVVIGILIALSINNWNANRIQLTKFKNTIETLEVDLNNNIAMANRVIENAYWKDSLIHLALKGQITREVYRENKDVRRLIRTFSFFNPSMDNVESALDYEITIPENYETIISHVKNLKFRFNEVEYSNKVSRERVINYSNYLSDKYMWYGKQDSVNVEREIDYLLTDSIYPNKLISFFESYLRNYIFSVIIHRNLSIGILAEIQKVKNDWSSTKTKEFIISKGLKPYKKIDTIFKSERKINTVHFRLANLFYNASDEKIQIIFHDDISRVSDDYLEIESKSYRNFVVSDTTVVEVIKSKNQREYFKASAEGFLFFE